MADLLCVRRLGDMEAGVFDEEEEDEGAVFGPPSPSLLIEGESSLSMLKRVGRFEALEVSQLWSSLSCRSALRLERPA